MNFEEIEMSRDADAQQRLWLPFGYGGKRADQRVWRYWKRAEKARTWIIAAPNGTAEFKQVDRTVYYQGEAILTGRTQWAATWRAIAHFYDTSFQRSHRRSYRETELRSRSAAW
jgi:hypothetical protein